MYVLHAPPQAFAARPEKGSPLCGIAGFTHRIGCPDPERIRKAVATLGHRGPDQMGVFRQCVRHVAGRYGTEHSEYDLNPDSNLRDTIEEFAYYSDEPSADAGALPIWYLSKLKRVLTKKQAKKYSKRKKSDSHAYVAGRKA